jgi:hypothetical protein
LDVVELENGTTKIYCLYMVHYGSIWMWKLLA